MRAYLLYLDDPAKLVDHEAIAALEADVIGAVDPIEKLKALAALGRARTVDGDALEHGFVGSARQWAADNDIPYSTFRELGVPLATLKLAGLAAEGRGGASRSVAGRGRPSTPGTSRSVSAAQIQAHIRSRQTRPFTLADIATDVGGSPMTIRKAVQGLLQSGQLSSLGPTPGWPGPGRAPIQYVTQTSS
ncbi:MAG: hypothetical protein JWM34_4128 [Ilumatobacteraceae bacterium]|nr:hypothetical protein [Ilumatobacteraceae bacterium]